MKNLVAIVFFALACLAARAGEWQLAEGYRIEEFAREPKVVDPVAMDWDAKGRLWVLESAGRIRIVDAEAPIFADDLQGATGLALRGDKVFVARAPEILMLQGTNRQVVVPNLPHTGARGMINSLRFGRDGWLYFTQGAEDEAEYYRFGTRSGNAELLSSGVARFDPETRRIEMVADGMVFPRGLAFNEAGELFVGDESRNHVFQIFHGVSHQRPLARDYVGYKPAALGALADHRFVEGEFFGLAIYRGMTLAANLRDKSLHRERLERKGVSYRARCEEYFLRRMEGEFQPVDLREGPDGALWILDRAGTDARNPFKTTGKSRVWRVVPSEKWTPPVQTNELITAVRAIRDQGRLSEDALATLARAARDADPIVRRETAAACRAAMLGTAAPGIPNRISVEGSNMLEVVQTLVDTSVKETDVAMEAVLWSALEPLLVWDTTATLRMFQSLEARDTPMAGNLFRHSVRRAFGANYEEHLTNIYPLVVELSSQSVPLCLAGVEGITYGQKSSKRYHRFDKSFRKLLKILVDTQQPALVAGGLQAGALCGYQDSRAEIVKRMLDPSLDEPQRLQAVQFAQVLRDEPARQALVTLLDKDAAIPNLTLAAAYSLKEIGRVTDVDVVLRAATKQERDVQSALGQTIAERRDWVQQVRAGRTVLPEALREQLNQSPAPPAPRTKQ